MNNKMFYTIALAFLSAVAHTMTQQLQADFQTGNVVLQNQVLLISKEITGDKPTLLNSNTLRVDGICSFDQGGKLDTGRAFVFDQIAIDYATNAASGKEGEVEYNTKAPAVLQNSVVVITQDKREVLRMPFRDLHNIETGQKVVDEYTELKGLGYFTDNKAITIDFILPPGTSLANTAKHYVCVRINGQQTAVRS